MYQILDEGPEYIEVKLAKKIDREEYAQVLSVLRDKLEDHEKIDVLVDLSELDKFTIGALWEDLKFDIKNFKAIRKFAIIGNGHTKKFLEPLSEPFVTEEAKFFPKSSEESARKWVHRH